MSKQKDYIFMKMKSNIGPVMVPAYPSDKANFDRFPYDVNMKFSKKSDRLISQHRKLFAIFRMVIHNDPNQQFKAETQVLSFVKMISGRTKFYRYSGKVIEVPDSIAFENMNQDEFNKFYKDVVPICANYLGFEIEDIDANYYEYM